MPAQFKSLSWVMMGALMWTLHFMLIYALAEFGCITGQGWVLWAMGIMTVFVLALSFYALFYCILWQKTLRTRGVDISRSLPRVGILSNAIFSFIIIFQIVPILSFQGKCL